MDESLRQVIFETFSDVFEKMFFTFLEPLSAVPASEQVGDAGKFILAEISYSGGNNGNFCFYFPWELAKNITINFLGVEDEDVKLSQIADTAAETANMAIGSLLGKLDPKGQSSLAIPKARELVDFAPVSLSADAETCMFNTEFGILYVKGRHE
ncbi:MAG: chemotaxis protein CheX [Desulfobulbaceae bacterium]|nr:chemotaxis protein CheX [Desulfobulbaceae bacterium]HIJ77779.1 chemotaxis protein CheX [Deltaproteobacteria bacterium]